MLILDRQFRFAATIDWEDKLWCSGLLIQCWVSHGLFLVFVSIWIEAQHHSNTAWSRVITRDEEFLVQVSSNYDMLKTMQVKVILDWALK